MTERSNISDDVMETECVDPIESVSQLKDKKSYVSKVFSLGTLSLRLFHVSSDLNNETMHGKDTVYNLVYQKKEFQRSVDTKCRVIRRKNLSTVFEDLERQMKRTKRNTCFQVPKYIGDFMEFLKEDPDDAFFGTYNWYYTGGCLQRFCFNDNNYLAYVGGKKNDNLYIAPLEYDPLWHIDESGVQCVTAAPEKEIFQVLCVEISNLNFIGIRQKDICQLYTYNDSRRLVECFNYVSDIPMSSFDISPVHQEICTIDVNKGLSFWDINKTELPMITYFPSDNPRHDNWHHLWYSVDPSVISIAGRKSIKWMDRRSSNIANSMKLSDLKEILNEDEISVHFASERNPYLIYVSTNVNLFLMDIRSLVSTVKLWGHYLSSPPVYSCIIPYGEEEIVCIGNQHPGNVVLAYNSKSEVHPLVEIPSRTESLLSLQASGLCLDPSVQPRISLGLTGLTCLQCKESSNVELLTQSVGSDIFSHSLFGKSSEVNSDDLSGFVSTKEEILYASDRWDMSKFCKNVLGGDIKQDPPKKKSTGKQPWQLSKQELLEYKDALSPIILAEWDVDIVNEKSSLGSEQKVSAWLDSSYNTVYTTQERYDSWEAE